MPSWGYLLIAIVIILVLIAVFFISYYLNKKTPVPKGCEHLLIGDENCLSCNNVDCEIRNKKIKEKDSQKEEN